MVELWRNQVCFRYKKVVFRQYKKGRELCPKSETGTGIKLIQLVYQDNNNTLFFTFLCRHCTSTTKNAQFHIRQRTQTSDHKIFFLILNLGVGSQEFNNSRRVRLHLTKYNCEGVEIVTIKIKITRIHFLATFSPSSWSSDLKVRIVLSNDRSTVIFSSAKNRNGIYQVA